MVANVYSRDPGDIRIDGSRLIVSGSLERFVSQLFGARKTRDGYTVPLLAANLDYLASLPGVNLPEELESLRQAGSPRRDVGQEAHPLWDKLMPHQRRGVDFLVSSPHRGSLLAFAPGLGKTLTAGVSAELIQANRVLWVTTPTLVQTTLREFHRWFPQKRDEVGVFWDRWPGTPMVITTYDRLSSRRSRGIKPEVRQPWDLVVLDESILVKSRDTRRHQSARQVCSLARRVWALSGAPVSRFYDDLFGQFSLLLPDVFTSYWKFATNVCLLQETVWGTQIIGNRPIDIKARFRDLMYVVSHDDAVNLPPFIFETRHLQLTPAQDRAYREMMKTFETVVGDQTLSAESRLGQIVRALQICSALPTGESCKLDAVEELLDTGYPLPMVVWVHFRQTGEALYQRLSRRGLRIALVTGETEDRDSILSSYLSGEVDILILSLGVGKFGLTLTNTRTVVYVDKGFRFDDYQQSLFRTRRLGLTHSPVVVSLHVPGTIDDELVVNNLIQKSYGAVTGNLRDLLRGLGVDNDHCIPRD